jgi:hypothetical protein
MRRAVVLALLISSLFVYTAPPIPAQDAEPAPLMSSNIQLVTALPNPGVIGARFKGNVMYVTTVSGLTTYDVSDPKAPVELGRLPLPHFENEDVDLAGDILLISNDASESTGILYVIDISDPAAPAILSTFQMGGSPAGGPGHTASCILNCHFAWVTDGGVMRVIDLRDPAAPVDLGTFELPTGGIAVHDMQVDGNGIAWVAGFNGTAGYKIPNNYDGPGDEKLLARTSIAAESTYDENFGTGDGSTYNDYIHHNSLRRKNDDVVYITEEDYTRPGCAGAGSFQTWHLPTNNKGTPTGAKLTPLDMWATEAVTEAMETPPGSSNPVTAMCSAHYFDLEKNLVAQGWYEQGVRFLDVSDPKNIRQIGYFIPPSAMTWAAYFPPTDPSLQTAYVFDATHGIDVLSIARPAKGALSAPHVACQTRACTKNNTLKARRAPILAEWRTAPTVGTARDPFGFACRLGLADVIGGLGAVKVR